MTENETYDPRDYDIICPACGARIDRAECVCDVSVLYPNFARFEGTVWCKCGATLRFSIYYVPTNDAPEVEVVDEEEDQ